MPFTPMLAAGVVLVVLIEQYAAQRPGEAGEPYRAF